MSLKPFLLFLIAFVLPSVILAQDKLLISRPGRPVTYEFHEGEMLRFRLKGEKYWNKAYIQGLYPDRIRFHYNTILLDEIEYIDVRDRAKGRFLHTFSWIGTRGGAGFAVIAQINKTIVHDEPGLEVKAVSIGAAIVAGGILLSLLKKRKVRLGRKYRIRISEF
ncbi:hypothetical protein LVD17_04110 [Fulvivirga ulvae]|uniref:hypothetical protein n=1 Tax=Fulvivirga ulvae TaxID=2904245 RepID=UPI001F21E757|nr:hypothetical protein [Fulvivirga ulvae]UII33012.1 hypothetical protein LVD17_04110 [Fulvivirga ulvae]